MKQFVPLTDELLYEHPEWIQGRLIPYCTGAPCYRWLAYELGDKTLKPADLPKARRGANRGAAEIGFVLAGPISANAA